MEVIFEFSTTIASEMTLNYARYLLLLVLLLIAIGFITYYYWFYCLLLQHLEVLLQLFGW